MFQRCIWPKSMQALERRKKIAFEWLEKAYEDRSILSNGFIKANPIFDPLRSDPRFDDLLRRTSLCIPNC